MNLAWLDFIKKTYKMQYSKTNLVNYNDPLCAHVPVWLVSICEMLDWSVDSIVH